MKKWSFTIQQLQKTPKSNKTKLSLAALAMSTIVSSTQVQATDLLAQCDHNNNWIIDWRTYLKEVKKELKSDWDYSEQDKNIYKVTLTNAKKERKCKTGISDQKIKQQRIYLAQLDTSIESLKRELQKVEAELSKNKAELKEVREELERKKQWLLEQIRKTQQSFR